MFRQFCKVLIIILPGPGGLCPDVVKITLNLDHQTDTPLQQLKKAVEEKVAKAEDNHEHLPLSLDVIVYFSGHSYRRHKSFSTRVITGQRQSFHLESSVQKVIQDAKNKNSQLGPCNVVYFVDGCMEFEDGELSDSESVMSNQADEPMQYFAYSVSMGKPQADNGLFATVLAYCLTCRVENLSSLFRNLKDLVSQLSFWRQIPYTLNVENDIELFPRAGGVEIQRPLTEAQRNSRLFESTFFLSRYLARLTSDKLLEWRRNSRNEPCKSNPDRLQEHILSTFETLSKIANVFEERKHLFKENSWLELELLVKCPCDDLEWFLKELKKVEQLPSLAESVRGDTVPEPKNVPQEIRDCLVVALRENIKDDYDQRPAEACEEDSCDTAKPPSTLVTDARDLVYELMHWFQHWEGTSVETKDGKKKWTYALVAEQAEVAPLPESELRAIAEFINEQSNVFKVPCKVFLAPGSLWIIIRSEGRLPMSEFLKGLAGSRFSNGSLAENFARQC